MVNKLTYSALEKKVKKLELEHSKHKNTEESLRESEMKFHSLIETTSDWLWEVDLNGKYTYASPKVKEILGYYAEEIIGVHLFDLLAKEEAQTNQAFFKDMIKQPESFSGRRVTQIRKDGTHVIIEINGAPVFDKHGHLSGFCGCDKDITQKVEAETALIEREAELDIKNESLEEMNAALRVLLKKREEDKKELEEKVLLNVQRLLFPFLDKLKTSRLDEKQVSLVNILKSNLEDIVAPFSRSLSSIHLKLTPSEIQISNLVKQGKSTKEIADLLNLSITTIETHRRNIRRKIGLKDRKQNLRTYLLDIPDE